MIQKGGKIIFLISSTLISLCLNAQFKYSASLDSVRQTGFYSIAITPELSSYLKPNLSDLRIVDEKKEWVPFIIEKPFHKRSHATVIVDQNIILKENNDRETVLVIENNEKLELSDFIFELKNAAAERTGSLSGSDDYKNWYVILDSLLLRKSDEYSDTSHRQRINFPASTYQYFKLKVYNNKKEALNILNAGSTGPVSLIDSIPPFFINPETSLLQTDSSSYSLVKIILDRPYQINMLRPVITKPWLYKRQAKLFTQIKNSLSETWYSHPNYAITISSDEFDGHFFPILKSDTLYLLIENGDNPPLHISSIETRVINRNIIAFLEKDKSYALVMDDPAAIAPVYDLEHFKDRIPRHSSINIKEISALPIETAATQKQAYKRWIWPVIILLLVLLSFMTWKLTADMKKRNN
jgi:hypothetical protein